MKTKQFIFTFIITFIVVMIWIIADIIHTKADIPVSSKLQQAIIPLNPNFDQATLEEISKKDILEKNNIKLPQPTPTPTPENTPTPQPVETQ